MSLQILFPHLRDFRLLAYSRETTRLVLSCERVTPSVPCPVCGTAADRIHSRYERTIWDLSVQNVQVLLHLHVRKFYCDRSDCPRRIFDLPAPSGDLAPRSLYLWSSSVPRSAWWGTRWGISCTQRHPPGVAGPRIAQRGFEELNADLVSQSGANLDRKFARGNKNSGMENEKGRRGEKSGERGQGDSLGEASLSEASG